MRYVAWFLFLVLMTVAVFVISPRQEAENKAKEGDPPEGRPEQREEVKSEVVTTGKDVKTQSRLAKWAKSFLGEKIW